MSGSQLSFYGRGSPPRDEGPKVWTVSQLVRGANRMLEGKFSNLWVEGEVAGLKSSGNGHLFFSLVDDAAAVPAAIWRSTAQRLRFRIEEGQALRVYGRLGIFPKQGRMQFYVDRAEPAGLGALMLELQQRKARLSAEGLFDPARKRPLPRWPRGLGVVTSAHGAAVHDILEVTRRRCPLRVVVSPAVVQGDAAPASLVRALTRLARQPGIDVIIIGRGGGSVEDLWAFNDERLARAIAASEVPIVSAVGHEVDVTICDLVADLRAATPSHAAELVVPDRAAAQARTREALERLVRAMSRRLLDERGRLDGARGRLASVVGKLERAPRRRLEELRARLRELDPRRRLSADRRRLQALRTRLAQLGDALAADRIARLQRLQAALAAIGPALAASRRRRHDEAADRLARAGRSLPRRARMRLARAAGALDALSPLAVLSRGYALARDADGRAVTDAAVLAVDDELRLRFARGSAAARVTAVSADDDGGGEG